MIKEALEISLEVEERKISLRSLDEDLDNRRKFKWIGRNFDQNHYSWD